MLRLKQAGIGVAGAVAAPPWLAAGAAMAQGIPAPGRYECRGANSAMAKLNFIAGPGTIDTSTKGFRGMPVHPGTGNALFHGAALQSGYQGRYSPGPPPQVAVLTVTGGASSEAGIICQMRRCAGVNALS